ncbi:hypothetical protein COB18_02855 [Candidatus Kaiserbacteria bacterium]|nr:MAG: hypothetical protein COB18_02855 [Candidatus Kaiserbacteria bacterium]
MKTVPLNTIFDIEYGNQFDYNKMAPEKGGINFVSRSSQSLGVVDSVKGVYGIKPYEAGLITVTLGGTYLLSSFVQEEEFYTAQNVKVLKPIKKMEFVEKLFYCLAISRNRFRYTSHGREANMSLDTLLVPEKMPKKWGVIKYNGHEIDKAPVINEKVKLSPAKWKNFQLEKLFVVSSSKDELMDKLTLNGDTPYVTSSDKNNGITDYVVEKATNSGNTITANRGGSVGYFFYQPDPYKSTPVDVRILTPKFRMNPYIGLFLKTILQSEKFRFNYSRKMGTRRLNELVIRLPYKNTEPDWAYMENYIKSLPYSASM